MKRAIPLLAALLLSTTLHAELQTKIVGNFVSIKQIDDQRALLQWKVLRQENISAVECVPSDERGLSYDVNILLASPGVQAFEKVSFTRLTYAEADKILLQVSTLFQ